MGLKATVATDQSIAHWREADGVRQSVAEHLIGVSQVAERLAAKMELNKSGALLGILHDLGKYSAEFQSYLGSANGLINPDEDGFVDAASLKGKVDHSSAGAQLIWKRLFNHNDPIANLTAQILALCVASHHSGLIDCITPEGAPKFEQRMSKSEEKVHLEEILLKIDTDLMTEIDLKLSDPVLVEEMKQAVEKIIKANSQNETLFALKLGFLTRMLFSCLIDADRIDTADFENPKGAISRQHGAYQNWDTLISRLNTALADFRQNGPIDQIRREISDCCFHRSLDSRGLFTLTVPTGGGKTLASLRFALHHAQKHHLDRIVFVIPYTSIIDQNAGVVRSILEDPKTDRYGSVVLEHHSNLTPAEQSWKAKILTENWDAPVVYTTSVQLLEALFGGGTRGVRRLHQLANSVIVFDEIQTLPIRCVHLFCNAINFLTDHCGSTVLLCTATQPLLGELKEKRKGILPLSSANEIVPNVTQLFQKLKRVEIIDQTKQGGWSNEALAQLIVDHLEQEKSCLMIVNTKAAAQDIYSSCKAITTHPLYHLSTSMCPAHRMEILSKIRGSLGEVPIACISTQLIEAGVDVDFDVVIRFVAGMDSVVQAAGRCNRHGKRAIGKTIIVNPTQEKIASLEDICIGKEITLRTLEEFRRDPNSLGGDLLSPQVMRRYFEYYFYNRSGEMDYRVGPKAVGRDDTLLNLLSTNVLSLGELGFQINLRQSFSAAANAFQPIDTATRGVIVPFGAEGEKIINELCSAFDIATQFELLRRAQRYTVSVFPHVLKKLTDEQAVHEVQEGAGILHLSKRYYSDEFGLTTAVVNEMETYVS
jgi:CRISPR-associated endonuclease/helicase Cas3